MQDYVVLTVLFIGANFYSYVSAVWIIAFVGFTLLIPFASSLAKRNKAGLGVPAIRWSLLLAFVVIFFGFNQIVYSVYLVNFLQRDYSLILIRFISVFLPSSGNVLTYRPRVSTTLTALNVGYTALILAIPVLFVLCTIIRRIRLRGEDSPHPTLSLLLHSMMLTAVLDSGLYFVYGTFDIKYVSIMFPLVSAVMLKYFAFGSRSDSNQGHAHAPRTSHPHNSTRVRLLRVAAQLFLVVILTMNVARFGLSIPTNQFSRFSNTDTTLGANWLVESYQGYPRVLSDMSTLGKIDMVAAHYNRQIGEMFYNLSIYNYVVKNATDPASFNAYANFIVVDAQDQVAGTATQLWTLLPPIGPNLPNLSQHADFNQVYSDGNVVIFAVEPTS